MTVPAALLDAARSGDAGAFEERVGPYRGELQAHCYRMLGSLHDAEDVVQDNLIRAWRTVGSLNDRMPVWNQGDAVPPPLRSACRASPGKDFTITGFVYRTSPTLSPASPVHRPRFLLDASRHY